MDKNIGAPLREFLKAGTLNLFEATWLKLQNAKKCKEIKGATYETTLSSGYWKPPHASFHTADLRPRKATCGATSAQEIIGVRLR